MINSGRMVLLRLDPWAPLVLLVVVSRKSKRKLSLRRCSDEAVMPTWAAWAWAAWEAWAAWVAVVSPSSSPQEVKTLEALSVATPKTQAMDWVVWMSCLQECAWAAACQSAEDVTHQHMHIQAVQRLSSMGWSAPRSTMESQAQ